MYQVPIIGDASHIWNNNSIFCCWKFPSASGVNHTFHFEESATSVPTCPHRMKWEETFAFYAFPSNARVMKETKGNHMQLSQAFRWGMRCYMYCHLVSGFQEQNKILLPCLCGIHGSTCYRYDLWLSSGEVQLAVFWGSFRALWCSLCTARLEWNNTACLELVFLGGCTSAKKGKLDIRLSVCVLLYLFVSVCMLACKFHLH